ncbi:MAG: PaaI family thioesterase [Bacteroidota bacterium]
MSKPKLDLSELNQLSEGNFPELLGIKITKIEEAKLKAEMPVKREFFAPNGFLHAGSIITLADTAAGYASLAHLPENGKSFTTLELKSNFIKATRKGMLECECKAEHLGRTTHVWRVNVYDQESRKKIAVFSCTQLILY